MIKKWTLLLMIAAVALLIPMFSANVSAQEDTSLPASLSITKAADKTSASPGETITYTYTITNTGNITVDNLTLEDDMLETIDLDTITSLAQGDNITVTKSYVVTENDLPGPITNTANVTGTDSNGNGLSAVDSVSVDLKYTASIEVTKTATPNPASLGDTITYTYTITNTGDVTVNNLTLEDDMLNTIDLDKTSLGQGDNVTATAEYTVIIDDFPEPIINTAMASGTDPLGNTINDNATTEVTLNAYLASIKVTKDATPNPASPHEIITYTYVITNTGNVTIDNLALEDDMLGSIDLNTSTSLDPGESIAATATYPVTIDDLPGPIVNIATARGNDPLNNVVTDNASASVSLTINKTLLTKAEILKLSRVPGKGIDTAPGLQKPFNPKSQAAEHAGKKDRNNEEEQLQIRQRTENHSDADGQLKIRQKTKHLHKK